MPKPSILARLRDYLTSTDDGIAGGIANSGVVHQYGIASPPAWSDPNHLAVIGELYGIADAVVVTRKQALELDVISKARRVLATNVGRLTLINRKGKNPAPMQMPYLQQPEEDRPLAATLTWTADALMFYPRTWWIVQRRDAAGWPARGGCKLLELKDAEFDSDGNLIGAWGKPVQRQDIIQFDSPDGGLLHDGNRTLRRAVVLSRAAQLAEANPVPSLNLANQGVEKLEPDQITDLLESWVEARRKYGVAYTDRNIKPEAMGIVDSQLLIEGQKQMDLRLARQIGLPAWAADVQLEGSTLNYQNRASRAWELIDLYLSTYLTPISSRLSMNDTTPIGWTTEFDTDELTRPDQKTRFETYEIGKRAGFVDDSWIEAQEGQPLKELA